MSAEADGDLRSEEGTFDRRKFLRRMAGGAAVATPLLIAGRSNSPSGAQSSCLPQPSSTVTSEQNLNGNAAVAGSQATYSRGDHSHGTPRPRHPQSGSHFIDFGSAPGYIQLGSNRAGGDFTTAYIRSTVDYGDAALQFVGPVGANGWGRPVLDMYGRSDGSVWYILYNDRDVNGAYGNSGGQNAPSYFDMNDCRLLVRRGFQKTWGEQGLISEGYGVQAGLAAHSPSYFQATIWKIYGPLGQIWEARDSHDVGFIDVKARGFITMSTRREKQNIRSLEPTREKLANLRPVRFNTPPTPDTEGRFPDSGPIHKNNTKDRLGLIAEEVAPFFPEAISWGEDDSTEGIDYAAIVAALVKSHQELSGEVAQLKIEVANLRASK